MFEKQAELNRRIGVDTVALPEADQPRWILNYCRAMSQEVAELTDSVPWKWWAKYQAYNKQNARVEIVDLFHFLISLAQVAGLTAADVHRLYMENGRRQAYRRLAAGRKIWEKQRRHAVAERGATTDLSVSCPKPQVPWRSPRRPSCPSDNV
ncbi:MAG: dUTPase [Kiritimatiellaeota bacterium]|nr:dUTPase [Kiritimatiellota bacterium]